MLCNTKNTTNKQESWFPYNKLTLFSKCPQHCCCHNEIGLHLATVSKYSMCSLQKLAIAYSSFYTSYILRCLLRGPFWLKTTVWPICIPTPASWASLNNYIAKLDDWVSTLSQESWRSLTVREDCWQPFISFAHWKMHQMWVVIHHWLCMQSSACWPHFPMLVNWPQLFSIQTLPSHPHDKWSTPRSFMVVWLWWLMFSWGTSIHGECVKYNTFVKESPRA